MKSLLSFVNETRLDEGRNDTRKATIEYNHLKFEVTMNGDNDIYIEWNGRGHWVLAGFYYNEAQWVVQENLDEEKVGEDDDTIIEIGKTKSLPQALSLMATYIYNNCR